MIEWRQVPWSLWAYSAVVFLGAILFEVKAHGQIPAKTLFAVVTLVWLYFLLKGLRWVWIGTVGIYVLSLVRDLISGSLEGQGVAFGLMGLVLLILPVTWRYFSGPTAVAGTRS